MFHLCKSDKYCDPAYTKRDTLARPWIWAVRFNDPPASLLDDGPVNPRAAAHTLESPLSSHLPAGPLAIQSKNAGATGYDLGNSSYFCQRTLVSAPNPRTSLLSSSLRDARAAASEPRPPGLLGQSIARRRCHRLDSKDLHLVKTTLDAARASPWVSPKRVETQQGGMFQSSQDCDNRLESDIERGQPPQCREPPGENRTPINPTKMIQSIRTMRTVWSWLRPSGCRLYRLMYVVVIGVSLVVSLCLATLRDDLSGGFTVGTYMSGVCLPMVRRMQKRHDARCRCPREQGELVHQD